MKSSVRLDLCRPSVAAVGRPLDSHRSRHLASQLSFNAPHARSLEAESVSRNEPRTGASLEGLGRRRRLRHESTHLQVMSKTHNKRWRFRPDAVFVRPVSGVFCGIVHSTKARIIERSLAAEALYNRSTVVQALRSVNNQGTMRSVHVPTNFGMCIPVHVSSRRPF